MSIPDVNIPINPVIIPWEIVMKAERAPEKVHERMLRTAQAFEKAAVPFVVIGGNAVAIWVATRDEGAVRNTKDVDVLLERRHLDQAARAMAGGGFDMAEVNGVTVFLDRADPMPSRGVHVLYAQEKVRPHDLHMAPPVKLGIRSDDGVPAIDLPELVVLKLIAFRDIDRVHIRDLIHVGLIDDALAERIPPDLRPRLEEIRANPDG
jgi:hypothetical protein